LQNLFSRDPEGFGSIYSMNVQARDVPGKKVPNGYQKIQPDGYEWYQTNAPECESYPVDPAADPKFLQLFVCYPAFCVCACCCSVVGYIAMLICYSFIAVFLAVALVLSIVCVVVMGMPVCFIMSYFESWKFAPPWSVQWISGLYLKVLYVCFQFEVYFHRIPELCAEDLRIDYLKPKGELKKFPADFTNVQVPFGWQEEQDNTTSCLGNLVNRSLNAQGPFGCIGWLFEDNLWRLPFIDSFDNFADDDDPSNLAEDPCAFAMRHVGNMYPNPYQEWDDKMSDSAMVRFAKNGMGAHRVDIAEEDGRRYFVVRTNMLSPLPVREGFANYGGDAYFDTNWNPVKIVDAGIGPEVNGSRARKPVTTLRGGPGWAEAKFRWRGSMGVLVTAVDHLYNIHLVVANFMVIAVREQLSPDHVIRRFLMPFTFNTIAVNDNAATNLCRRKTLAARCFAFDDKGLEMAFGAGPNLLRFGRDVPVKEGGPMLDYERYCDWLASKGVDTEYYRQGRRYWQIMKKFVTGIIEWWYPSSKAMLMDEELKSFSRQYLEGQMDISTDAIMKGEHIGSDYDIDQHIDKGDDLSFKRAVINMLTSFCTYVTGHHEQVGAIEVYVQDVSFCAFKWTPGQLCGTRQTATAQALLMMMTATPMPHIWNADNNTDWTYVFEDLQRPAAWGPSPGDYRAVFAEFQRELGELHTYTEANNAQCRGKSFPNNFPMDVWDPAVIETSISV
jgi:hypothetical protein